MSKTDLLPPPYLAPVAFDEPKAFVYLGTILVAGLAGIVAASGNFSLIAVLFGLITASVFLPSRRALLLLCVFGGLVITGTAQLYIPGSRLIRYVIPMVSVVLFTYAIMDALSAKKTYKSNNSLVSIIALIFFLNTLVSVGLNWDGLAAAFDSFRAYFQMWLLIFCFSMIAWEARFIDALPKLFIIIALIQLPLLLHQFFVLVPARTWLGDGVVAVDILVGTFGGEKFGGGANSVLSLFLLLVSAGLLAIWRRGALKASIALPLCLLFLTPSFFNQAKITAIYIPIALGLVFLSDIKSNPGRFFLLSVAVACITSLLFVAMISAEGNRKTDSFGEFFETMLSRQTASIQERSGPYAALTRVTALTFWADQHRTANISYTLFGHGPGASRVQSKGLEIRQSLAERRYDGLQIGVTAAAALLWDTGLIGLCIILSLFFSVFRSARRSALGYAMRGDPLKAGILEGVSAGVLLMAISLFHKDYFVFNLPYQTLLMTVFGYVVYQEKLLGKLKARSDNEQ